MKDLSWSITSPPGFFIILKSEEKRKTQNYSRPKTKSHFAFVTAFHAARSGAKEDHYNLLVETAPPLWKKDHRYSEASADVTHWRGHVTSLLTSENAAFWLDAGGNYFFVIIKQEKKTRETNIRKCTSSKFHRSRFNETSESLAVNLNRILSNFSKISILVWRKTRQGNAASDHFLETTAKSEFLPSSLVSRLAVKGAIESAPCVH